MIEVSQNLYIGNQDDFDFNVSRQNGWWVLHACKEPYHRDALGYSTRGAPKSHPEYLWARRENRLMMNIVDTENPAFFAKEMIQAGLNFIDEGINLGKKVLIHCNQGESRSPSIGLLYLASRARSIPSTTLQDAENEFRKLYPTYLPKAGIRGHLEQYWDEYNSTNSKATPGLAADHKS